MQTKRHNLRRAAIAAALAALALGGCVPARQETVPDIDTDYLAGVREREEITFEVDILEYGVEEADVIEAAWDKAASPEGGLTELWARNGLRAGWADAEGARALGAQLRRASTLKRSRHVILMQAFDVIAGPRVAETGLVYATKGETAYRDVEGVQAMLAVRAVGWKGDSRVEVSPFFTTGEGAETVQLDGVTATFPVTDGGVILAGPVKEPAPLTLGSMMFARDKAETRGSLVLVEMRVSR
jgi:hypothetical protein